MENKIKKKHIDSFVGKMRIVLANKNAHAIVDSIFNDKLIKRSFKNWVIFTKTQKVTKLKQKNNLNKIITKIKA